MDKQMTKEDAITLAKTSWWKKATPQQITAFQLFEEKLCMDFAAFHDAVETTLGTPVWTHEFASPQHLRDKFLALGLPEEIVNYHPITE